jgi:hypothetical protein
MGKFVRRIGEKPYFEVLLRPDAVQKKIPFYLAV